jgi:type VI secretion system secreted protein VgrG
MSIKCDGDLTIEAGGKVTVTSGADMSLESGAKGTFEASGDLTVESSGGKGTVKASTGLDLKTDASATLKGLKVEVNSDASTAVKSSGITEVKGSLVKIN